MSKIYFVKELEKAEDLVVVVTVGEHTLYGLTYKGYLSSSFEEEYSIPSIGLISKASINITDNISGKIDYIVGTQTSDTLYGPGVSCGITIPPENSNSFTIDVSNLVVTNLNNNVSYTAPLVNKDNRTDGVLIQFTLQLTLQPDESLQLTEIFPTVNEEVPIKLEFNL